MKPKKPSRKEMLALCSEVGSEDGVDPRDLVRKAGPKKRGRKMQQLCAQIARTLDLVLSGECADDVLRDCGVIAVQPAPDASRVLVTVSPNLPGSHAPAEMVEHLQRAAGKLRSDVAAAINRKRAPELLFQVVQV